MKTVYFVRHGETEGNRERMWQHPTISLSEKGRQQAAFVGRRFASIRIEALISSPMTRARETAQAIAETTGCIPLECDYFHEVLRPSEVRGKKYDDPSIAHIVQFFNDHFDSPDVRHSDEENFFDVQDRARRAVTFLEERPESRICVVTHGEILRHILCVMMRGDDVDPAFFKSIRTFLYPSNTGITRCVFGKFDRPVWMLETWNDDAHLGEVRE